MYLVNASSSITAATPLRVIPPSPSMHSRPSRVTPTPTPTPRASEAGVQTLTQSCTYAAVKVGEPPASVARAQTRRPTCSNLPQTWLVPPGLRSAFGMPVSSLSVPGTPFAVAARGLPAACWDASDLDHGGSAVNRRNSLQLQLQKLFSCITTFIE